MAVLNAQHRYEQSKIYQRIYCSTGCATLETHRPPFGNLPSNEVKKLTTINGLVDPANKLSLLRLGLGWYNH